VNPLIPAIIEATVIVAGFLLSCQIKNSTNAIMSKLSDLESTLVTITTELEKAQAEIVSAVAALQDQINNAANPELSAGAQAALDRLTAVAKSLDDLNPDAPAPVPVA